MKRLASITSIALAGLLATACATADRQMARSEAVSLLNDQPTEVASHANEVVGLTAITHGDRWTGANLLEQAVDAAPSSVSARFNLATGYLKTGRLAEAATLYRGLVNDGQYTWAVSRRDPEHPNITARRFNIAEESARRLADIDRRLTYANASSGAFAATEAGTPVAAIVGATPRATGRISDAEALRRDGIQ